MQSIIEIYKEIHQIYMGIHEIYEWNHVIYRGNPQGDTCNLGGDPEYL